jgi:ABC-type transport system involved in multi-copper enzyme maturation permease subunit
MKKPFSQLVIIFLIITALLIGFKNQLQQWNIDVIVALIGNALLFLAALFSFLLFSKGLQTTSAHAFVRMTYSGMLLKMGICLAATIIYALASGGKVNKAAIFVCFGFYFIYTFFEVKILTRMSKEQKNA